MSELRVTVRYDGSQLDAGTAASAAALKKIEGASAPAGSALQKVAGSAAFSGAKMAKFGTVTAALTGTMGALPVKGEAVAKVFGVIGDLAAGAVNPIYLVVAAVGAAAAAFTLAKQRREEENRTIREANDLLQTNLELLQRRAAMNPGDQAADYLVRGGVDDLQKRITEAEARRQELLQKMIIGGSAVWKTNPNATEYMEGKEVVLDYVKAWSPKKLADMKKEAGELTAEIDKAQAALNKLIWTPDLMQAPEAPDNVLEQRRREAEEYRRWKESRPPGDQYRRFPWEIGGVDVPADMRPRTRFRSAAEDRQLGQIPNWLSSKFDQSKEDDDRRMAEEKAKLDKTTALYNEQIQTIRGTLDSMFSAAWQNANQGFEKMVQEMAKAAAKHLAWFFIQKGLDSAAPGIGSLLGFSPQGDKSMSDSFGAGATARANLQRRMARG